MVSIRKFGCRGGRVSGNGLREINEARKSLGVELHSADASSDVNSKACGWKKCSIDLKLDTNHGKERCCTPIIFNNSVPPPLSSSSKMLAAAQVKVCIPRAKKGQSKGLGFCDEYIYDNLSGTLVLSDEEMSEDVLRFASLQGLQGQEDSNSESDAEVWANNMDFEKGLSNNEQDLNRVRSKPGVEAASKERYQKSIWDHEEKAIQCASGNVGEQIPTSCPQTVEDCERDVVIKTSILPQFSNRHMTNNKFFAGENTGPSKQRKRILNVCDEYIYDHLSGNLVRMSDEESIEDFSGMVCIKSDQGNGGSDAEITESNAESEKKPFVAEQDQKQLCAAFKVKGLSILDKTSESGDVDVGFQAGEPLMPTGSGKYCLKNADTFSKAEVCKNPITGKQIEESICNRFAKRGHSRILRSSDEYIYDSLSVTTNRLSDEDNDEHLSGSWTMRSEEDSNDLDTEIWATSREWKKLSRAEMEERHAVSLDAKSPANTESILVDAGCSTQAFTCLVKKNDVNLPATGSGRNNSILFWLIEAEVVKENAEVQYLRKKDKKVMKEGKLTSKGVLCTCCDQLFTLSRFEAHAGSKLHRPAANMFLADGRSLVECQSQASQLLDLQ